jgi:hypothetical protein
MIRPFSENLLQSGTGGSCVPHSARRNRQIRTFVCVLLLGVLFPQEVLLASAGDVNDRLISEEYLEKNFFYLII